MTKTTYNDFRPETRSLINRLKKAGFQITGGDNGENSFKADCPDFLGELLATDETHLFVTFEEPSFTVRYNLFLVVGNSPGELVADYSYPSLAEGGPGKKVLDAVLDAHYAEWDGRRQPTVEK